MKIKNNLPLIILVFLSILVIGGCHQSQEDSDKGSGLSITVGEENLSTEDTSTDEENLDTKKPSTFNDIELTDVLTGETFKISDFAGTPILFESFAVWCPTCRKQQEKIKELHEEIGDEVISISLDTDPNEDAQQVIDHANRYEFDWRFAVSPTLFTQKLIDEFGVSVINAPSAPVVLICPDQSKARLLKRGVKSPSELKEAIASC